MIMYDKNIVLNLIVVDQETEEEIYSGFFDSIEELNEFLKKPTIKEPFLPEIRVEVYQELPDNELIMCFGYELSCLYELDEDDIEEFEEAFELYMNPQRIQLTPEIETEDLSVSDYIKLPLSSYKYLCPHCWNEVEECCCSSYPYFLIQIDAGMTDIVKMLNLKGYKTTSTCEGHFESAIKQLQINFKEKYNIKLPNEFYNDGWGIRYNYTSTTKEVFEKEKNKILKLLRETVNKFSSLY